MTKLIWFLLYCLHANADNLSLKYGVGAGGIEQKSISDTKYVSIGYEAPIAFIFRSKLEGGAWFEANESIAAKSSGFGSISFGMRVEANYIYIDNYFGASYVNTTDETLGIPFEFTEELGIGIIDAHGRSTGIEYRHFSNAGISKYNKGRDFLLINIGIPL